MLDERLTKKNRLPGKKQAILRSCSFDAVGLTLNNWDQYLLGLVGKFAGVGSVGDR